MKLGVIELLPRKMALVDACDSFKKKKNDESVQLICYVISAKFEYDNQRHKLRLNDFVQEKEVDGDGDGDI